MVAAGGWHSNLSLRRKFSQSRQSAGANWLADWPGKTSSSSKLSRTAVCLLQFVRVAVPASISSLTDEFGVVVVTYTHQDKTHMCSVQLQFEPAKNCNCLCMARALAAKK